MEILACASGTIFIISFILLIIGTTFFDWEMNIIRKLLGTIIISFILVAVFAFMIDSKSPTISLKKNEFECTESHKHTSTTFVMSGKVMIPITSIIDICDNYHRIK